MDIASFFCSCSVESKWAHQPVACSCLNRLKLAPLRCRTNQTKLQSHRHRASAHCSVKIGSTRYLQFCLQSPARRRHAHATSTSSADPATTVTRNPEGRRLPSMLLVRHRPRPHHPPGTVTVAAPGGATDSQQQLVCWSCRCARKAAGTGAAANQVVQAHCSHDHTAGSGGPATPRPAHFYVVTTARWMRVRGDLQRNSLAVLRRCRQSVLRLVQPAHRTGAACKCIHTTPGMAPDC